MKKNRKTFIILTVILMLFIATFFIYLYPRLGIVTGYSAKAVCSCIFVAGREKKEVEKTVLYHSLLPYAHNTVDTIHKSVTSSFFGLKSKKAVFKEGVGCILLTDREKPNFVYSRSMAPSEYDTLPKKWEWVTGHTQGIHADKLEKTVLNAFDEGLTLKEKRTTAVIVIHRDTIVAEKYAPPFHQNKVQLGWSMTKSIMNTFIGLMVMNGKVDLSQIDLFPNWKNDSRKNIALNDLLQMSSGLEWEEDYTKVSDVTRMLYESDDVSNIPLSKKLLHEPGKKWHYSSGTTNLISKYIRDQFHNDEAYFSYIYRRLFSVLDMESMILETDPSGHYIGSSYAFATPRDWAKFGLLYLHDGVWLGKRLLPDYWVNYTTTPVADSDGNYGAHFWLNKEQSHYKDAPVDMFFADGYQGQFVFIIPSRDLVIVRMGTGDKKFDSNEFLKNILANIPEK